MSVICRYRNVLPAVLAVVLAGCSKEPTRRLADPPEPPPDMTRAEKIAGWKGERVALLPSPFISADFRRADQPRGSYIEKPRDYQGRTGTIVEVRTDPLLEIVVELDGSRERVIAWKELYLGFFGELEKARALVGTRLWALGRQPLLRDGSLPTDSNRQPELLEIPPGGAVSVTAADWGTFAFPVRLKMRDDRGQEAWLYLGSGSACLERRFHITPWSEGVCNARDQLTRRFHSEDLRKVFPDWGADVWRLVESGAVSLGMTEDMVRVACGFNMQQETAVLVNGKLVGTVYRCNDKLFAVKKGKVAEFLPEGGVLTR